MKVPEKLLEQAEAQAIESANEIIGIWGDEQGARILRICLGVYARKIADCEQIAQMRDAYSKLGESNSVPARPKFSVIQGGAR